MALMEIPRKSKVNCDIRIPGSKSLTHRAYILSFLSGSKCLIRNPSLCEDTFLTLRALEALGCNVRLGNGWVFLDASNIRVPGREQTIEVGESGTTLRLILGVLALFPCKVRLVGRGRLNKRPVGHLVRALREMGVSIKCYDSEGYLPLTIKGGNPKGGSIKIYGGESSQYISSLMLIGPLLQEGITLEVEGPLVSWPYVRMTAGIMAEFGADVEVQDHIIRIRYGGYYHLDTYYVEPDCSNASYFMGLPLVVGGRIFLKGISPRSLQGDIGILTLIEQMGGKYSVEKDGIWVEEGRIRNIEADMKDMPDLVPTIAALAVHAKGPTFIRNAPHLRLKESDRIESICREWKKLNVETTPLEDGLIIHGKGTYKGAMLDSRGDHRMAMAIALLGSKSGGIRLVGHESVKKSFPEFWNTWLSL